MSKYRDKLLEEIKEIPEEIVPTLYKIVRILTKELMLKKKKGNRGSLKGIWKGSQIDETLFLEAKQSLFLYEYKR